MRKILLIAAICAVFALTFPFRAYAAEGEPSVPPMPVSTPASVAPPVPFTPSGTGTVIDNGTDEDGKEFYTIMTPDENVFYLVIDRQRGTENVYFLNAVTEQDLLALAGETIFTDGEDAAPDGSPAPEATAVPDATPQGEPGAASEPAPEQGGIGIGTLILVGAVILVGGGAGWYFKIYKPKQERAVSEEDADYSEDEADPYGGTGQEDSPAWYGANEDSGDGDE